MSLNFAKHLVHQEHIKTQLTILAPLVSLHALPAIATRCALCVKQVSRSMRLLRCVFAQLPSIGILSRRCVLPIAKLLLLALTETRIQSNAQFVTTIVSCVSTA